MQRRLFQGFIYNSLFGKIIFAVKIKFVFIISIFFCWTFIYAQNKENKLGNLESFRGCKECRPSDGSCSNVIQFLQVSQENDSIAIEIFNEEYEIVNMNLREKKCLLKMDHIEMIKFFTKKKNKKFNCRSKMFKSESKIFKRYDPALLVD